MWDEAEWVINQFPYIYDEGTWLEMQIWEDNTLKKFYQNSENITDFVVEERLSEQERVDLIRKYSEEFRSLTSDLFFSPNSVHGLSHARRVLVLSDIIADYCGRVEKDRKVLKCAAAFHDIGRMNHKEDENHGVESYKKMEERNVIPSDIEAEDRKLLQYIVEEHPRDFEKAKKRLNELNIHDKQRAADLLSILKDADTLDRCRFGNVDILYLINPESKKLVNLGYQLLTIYPEILN